MAPSASDVLRLDGNGNPRTLRLFALLVEAESRRFAAAASQPAENDLVRAFRGGATPTVPIAEFLECVQRCNYLFDGGVYVLAAAYLALFIRSPAALEAGILVEPATAHRLVSVAVLLGAKFSSPRYFERRVESFQICSGQSIRSSELCPLEVLFLRALDYRVFISDEEFRRFQDPGTPSSCSAQRGLRSEEEKGRGGGGTTPRASMPASRPLRHLRIQPESSSQFSLSHYCIDLLAFVFVFSMEVVFQWRSSRGKGFEDEKPELLEIKRWLKCRVCQIEYDKC